MSDFQTRASVQGRQFEEICRTVLTAAGFECLPKRRVKELQVEIDVPAISPTGREIWFECKGSWIGTRPGLQRTDTLRKAIAQAYIVKYAGDYPAMVLLTSHLPRNAGALWLALINGSLFEKVINISDPEQTKVLYKLAQVDP